LQGSIAVTQIAEQLFDDTYISGPGKLSPTTYYRFIVITDRSLFSSSIFIFPRVIKEMSFHVVWDSFKALPRNWWARMDPK
jgi:hypothetical protein